MRTLWLGLIAVLAVSSLLLSTAMPASAHSLSSRLVVGAGTLARLRIAGEETCASPPANFNPITASDAEIAFYGFPKRPDDPSMVADWASTISGAKHRICGNGPTIQRGIGNRKTVKVNSVNTFSSSWSGVSVVSASPTVNGARGWFQAICPTGTPGGVGNAQYAAWVGIGGSQLISPLWQAGWDGITKAFWYEQVGGPNDTHGEVVTSFASQAYCGSTAYVYVDYNKTQPGGTYAYMYTYYNGDYRPVWMSNNVPDTTTVEWIDERPGCPSGGLYQLANYNMNGWNGDYWFTGQSAYHPIDENDSLVDYYNMVDSAGHLVSYPGVMSSLQPESFFDHWVQYAQDHQCG